MAQLPDPSRRPPEATDDVVTPLPGEGWGLYVHFPWCVRKCPYCDFNSHVRRGPLPWKAYVEALAADLARAVDRHGRRPVATVFLGGGTPNLFPPEAIAAVLETAGRILPLAGDAEVTLEANPGADDRGRWRAYREAGVTRLSLGLQSLDDRMLRALGRIHDAAAARRAYEAARAAGFASLNVDLMTGLPGQDLAEALADLDAVLALAPDHVSWYELTYEAGTPFARRPPPRLDDDARALVLERGRERLARAGYRRYEVSAFARAGHRGRHNLGYWMFSDYLGIGAGAHAKIAARAGGGATGHVREARVRDPGRYLALAGREEAFTAETVTGARAAGEFFLNVWRIVAGFTEEDLRRRTGTTVEAWQGSFREALARGLACQEGGRWRPTARGLDMLLDLQELFLEPLG